MTVKRIAKSCSIITRQSLLKAVTVTLTLANPKSPDIQPVQAEALVDTGAVHLAILEHVKIQLQLEEQGKKEPVGPD